MPSLAREEKIIDDALERMHEMNRRLIYEQLAETARLEREAEYHQETQKIPEIIVEKVIEKKKGRFDLIDLG